jgi:EAL domain-containing protein (putative c-di-GMP-specific phosphodiesterase class I)
VHLATGALHGFAALLEWQHPSHGRLDWERIAPIAEHTGMTVTIGRWLLHEACRQAAQWTHSATPLSVSVPVSGQQLASTTLLEDVRAALEASGLRPHQLQLDITERDAMQRPEYAHRTLASLKSLGVTLVLDHFGTGYSSLRHLQSFAVNALKIERSFVAGMEQGEEEAAMVHVIVALAKSLRVEVIARGVDEPAHLQFLREIGCHRGQGRLYSVPLPGHLHS